MTPADALSLKNPEIGRDTIKEEAQKATSGPEPTHIYIPVSLWKRTESTATK